MFKCETLDQFLTEFGDLLCQKARAVLDPLHVPGRDAAQVAALNRRPFEAQAHVTAAAVKALGRQKAVQLIAEMGTGKTLMSVAVVQSHAEGEAKAGRTPAAEGATMVSLDFITKVIQPTCSGASGGLKIKGTFRWEGKEYVAVGLSGQGVPGKGRYHATADCYEVVTPERWGRLAKAEPGMGHLGTQVSLKGKKMVLAERRQFACVGSAFYRAVVVCPGQLVEKWKREIEDAVPNARVKIVEDWRDLLPLVEQKREGRAALERAREVNRANAAHKGDGRWHGHYSKEFGVVTDPVTRRKALELTRNVPEAPEWYVVGRDRAKLSSGWRPAYRRRSVPVCDRLGKPTGERAWLAAGGKNDEGLSRCPGCGGPLLDKNKEPLTEKWLKGGRRACPLTVQAPDGSSRPCGEQLWQDAPKPRRYAPARLIQKKLRRFIDYAIVDEAHEYKSDESLQADAVGGICAAAKKVIALTGTLVGGYAWHVRTLLYRVGVPHTLIADGYGWKDKTKFDQAFGRIETKEVVGPDDSGAPTRGHAYGRGGVGKSKKQSYCRPGIMPTLFKHLIWNSVFLSLDEVAADLPKFVEEVVEVPMAAGQREAYDAAEKDLTGAIRQMVQRGDKSLLGTMLNVLLCYPDYPFGWGRVGYWSKDPDSRSGEGKVFNCVTRPRDLPEAETYPKEEALVRRVLEEKAQGRQCWVYAVYTDKRDCVARLEERLKAEGLRVAVMRSSVPPEERERWINDNGFANDVIVSHPELVKTGLDFFSKRHGHNYVTILFYQTGYNLFTLRQAARRAWRIGQRRECRVVYFNYEQSMQSRAMTLMGRKLSAANALEGRFSPEGLAAMAGEDENLEMALAKSLAESITEDVGAARAWAKLSAPRGRQVSAQEESDILAMLAELDSLAAS